jgi:hemerythrin superfamily protein
MDALDVLKSDHERVSSLYRQIKAAGSADRAMLLDQIKNELLIHTHIEESVFYPAFKNYPDCQDIVARSYNEHREIKSLLGNVDAGRPDLLDEVMSKVQAHVQEEEGEFFVKVRKIMKRSERETLGRHLLAAKSEGIERKAA